MARLTQVIGGHTVRFDPRIDPGVSINMFPELGERQFEQSPRPPLFMLSTHGYERFLLDADRVPVTGMTGTRERQERLLVANGREIRCFTNPDDSTEQTTLTIPGQDGQRLRPVLGACNVGTRYYWVRDDGKIWTHEGEVLETGLHALGLACTRNAGLSDVDRLFFSCVEDRWIRVIKRTATGWEREEDKDLDLGDTAVVSPESLWMDLDGSRLLILDAVAARVLEYGFSATASETWTKTTPFGVQNPLNLQRLLGDPKTEEPVVLGGIWGGAADISVIIRPNKIATIGRRSGILNQVGGEPALITMSTSRAVCGAVGGRSVRTWFVSGSQYSDGRGKFFTDSASVSGIAVMEDVEDPHPEQTPFVAMGDDGNLIGWRNNRRLHLVDMGRNRVIQNVEGSVDSLAFGSGRLIAADSSTGFLKVSPPSQVRLESGERYGQPVAAASLSVPGWPRKTPNKITSFVKGVRSLLARTDDNSLWRWNLGDLNAAPVKVSGTANVAAVLRAGTQVMVLERQSSQTLRIKRYANPPDTEADYNAPNEGPTSLNLSYQIQYIHSFASDEIHLFFVYAVGNNRRNLIVYRLNGGQPNNSTISNWTGSDSELFEDLDFQDSDGQNQVNDWLRGITFTEGALLVGLKQTTGNDTVVRAFEFNGTNGEWTRSVGQDLTNQVSTENAILSHDGQFVYDSTGGLVSYELPDGTQATSTSLAAFRAGATHRLSQYSWDPAQSERTGARAVVVIRRVLYAWTATAMEIRDLSDETEGFPYRLQDTRTVGLISPDSLAIVDDALYWLGSTSGGGLRVWSIGRHGDTDPEALQGKAIEEMLDKLAAEGVDLSDSVAWSDDQGGHPVYVLGFRGGGISIAFDADSEKWHTRSSLRAVGSTPHEWPWLDDSQGFQRVTSSTTWRNRLIVGGYDKNTHGVLSFASTDDWRDVDQGKVTRVRQFPGVDAERRLVRHPALRIDAVYGQAGGGKINPMFLLKVSNDGGNTFGKARVRKFGPRGGRPVQPFYRLGISEDRVYRVECSDPVPFVLKGAMIDVPAVSRKI